MLLLGRCTFADYGTIGDYRTWCYRSEATVR